MYSLAVRLAALCLVLACEPAFAGGLVVTSSPRSIGRAGAATVGDDGGGALLVNPAAIARRAGKRAELGMVFVDDTMTWQSDTAGTPGVRDQAPASLAPYGAAFGSTGSWTFGLGAMTAAVSDRSFRRPTDITDPANIDAAFDYRYAGIAGGVRRDTLTAGVARRIGDSLALGLAVGASRVSVIEIRRLWAGFSGRDDIGSAVNDLEIGFEGTNRSAACCSSPRTRRSSSARRWRGSTARRSTPTWSRPAPGRWAPRRRPTPPARRCATSTR